MDNYDREALYRQLASSYVEYEGERLQQECSDLERRGISYLSPHMDRQMRRLAGRHGRGVRAAVLVAACFALILLVPRMLYRQSNGMTESTPVPEWTEREEAYDEEAETGTPDDAPQLDGGAAVIPLSFELPPNFSVASVEQDHAQSIYCLRDSGLDDVVMTLECADNPLEAEELTPLELEWGPAWAASSGDYNLLMFEAGEVRYTLTCRYDLNTLLPLADCAMMR